MRMAAPRMSSPVKGYVSQEYKAGKHLGMDIATGGKALDVHATFAGTVDRVVTGRKPGNTSTDSYAPGRTGNYVAVKNPDGERQLYNHTLARSGLRVGDKIDVGEIVGKLDLSGQNTGYHVHYEEWTASGATRDPRVSFNAFGVTPGATPYTPKENDMADDDNDLGYEVWSYKNPDVNLGDRDVYSVLRGIYDMVADIHKKLGA